MITQEYLRRNYDYNPDTGVLKRLSGKQISSIPHRRDGYLRVGVNYKPYLVHRVIWLYMYGYMPECVDHINGIGHDNRLCNLREANKSQNGANFKSEHKGVERHGAKFRARIKHYGKKIELGSFDTLEEAKAAYASGHKSLFGEFSGFN